MKTGTYRFKEPIKGCELIGRLEELISNNEISNSQMEPTNPALRKLRVTFLEDNFIEMTVNRAKYYSDLPYTISINDTLPDGLYGCIERQLRRIIEYIDVSQGLRKFIEQAKFFMRSSTFDIAELNDELQEEVSIHPINNDKLPFYLNLKIGLMKVLHYLTHLR